MKAMHTIPLPHPAPHRVAAFLDTWLGHCVEIPAALLVLAEIVVLFAGVTSRYALHTPLVWSDELASMLFLWLAMLGAVVALRRGEHMRMTALVGMASPGVRAFLDVIAIAAPLAFLLMVIGPAVDFAQDESFITTPALDIANSWRAAALPIGAGLMLLVACLRLVRVGNWKLTIGALALVAAVAVAFYAASPLLKGLGNLNLLIFFVGLVALCVLSGVPIAFSFGLATFGYLALTTSTPLVVVVGRMDEGMSHLILLSVPLFVFLGQLIEMTGMANAMIAFLASMLGHVRGGLSYVLVGAMYLVSGISGSKAADMAAVAPVLFPEMKARGAKPGDLVALLAATGAQTETIPPSLVLITLGSVTGVSISALFTGGMLPGIVLAVTLCTVVWWRYRSDDLSGVKRATRKEIVRKLAIALPALALPFVIRAAVVEGIATATEVSTIGIALCGDRGSPDLSPLRMGALEADADRYRRALRRDPADHRRGDEHGVGAHAVGLLGPARAHDGRVARRHMDVHGGVDTRVHRARQRAGRHSRDRAVRAADVPDRAPDGHQRRALRDGRDPLDGRGPVRAAVRRRLLLGLRGEPHPSG